ncbi:sulfatase [Diplocloster agilis]|uniref:sulfatase n=1 Tax=Diplocloster agilis TaxID=2850323 RepID=UPI00293F14A5|nr:sulfatase [Suonthocola fibrivorans]
MYDSLNLRLLQSYGCDWTYTPNFLRLAERCTQFENNYVCSMPCIPARRELHTGRANFLHRSWGPLEPFDDSMPELLKKNGVYTHLISDHMHYWEDGGATYHTRYSSWEVSRGQEGDAWKADLGYEYKKESVFESKKEWLKKPSHLKMIRQDAINRSFMCEEEKTSQAVTFESGLEFIHRNQKEDNWFLQIETFDPHEPFYTLPEDRKLYKNYFRGDEEAEADWPPYAQVAESREVVETVRAHYASLLSKCDRYLGKVLDLMDEYQLWEDTMLIVNTDHGYLLGEHGYWGKSAMPLYEEISHTPLYIYDPGQKDKAGIKRNAITQSIDLAPTILSYFGVKLPKDMLGRPLQKVIGDDSPVRDYAVFGYFGSQINVTDGTYMYMHSAAHPEMPIYEYTLMPTHMRNFFYPQELETIELREPFSFTKGFKVMKTKGYPLTGDSNSFGSALYDLRKDNSDNVMEDNPEIVGRMKEAIKNFLTENDSPSEIYERMGI